MKKIFLVLIVLIPITTIAQDSDLGNWFIFLGNKKLDSRWDFHYEVQYRNYNAIGDLEQLLLRTGIGYNLTENNNNLLLGYGYILSENYIGDTDDKVTYRYEKNTLKKCETCDHYVTTKASLYSMSRQFGSNFKSAKKSLKTYVHRAGQQGDSSAVIRDADFISHKKKIACFDLDTMDDTFETLSRQAEKSLPKFIRGVLNN